MLRRDKCNEDINYLIRMLADGDVAKTTNTMELMHIVFGCK